jgi:hypothetical protein
MHSVLACVLVSHVRVGGALCVLVGTYALTQKGARNSARKCFITRQRFCLTCLTHKHFLLCQRCNHENRNLYARVYCRSID